MNKEIEIYTNQGIKKINQDSLFIIAEVGNQFGGSLEKAKHLAKIAKDAGADAVKYIFWFPDEIMADKDLMYSYETIDGLKTENMFELLVKLQLPFNEWMEVKEYCDDIGIIMMSTVNSPTGFQWAMDLSLPILKLSSWDYNFTDLWQWCARTYLPTIADLSPVTEEELQRNINIFREEKNYNLIFLHCFHTQDYKQFNMNTIEYIRDKYDCLVGYSPAGRDDITDIMSVTLGACILEKRLTLSTSNGVLHDSVSKTPEEFKEYILLMRKVKEMVGQSHFKPSDNDWLERKKWFRRIVADTGIAKGEVITRNMLEAKRGETNISPEKIWDFTGKKATRDIKKNEDINYADVE
jgi:sialic acid synthase SpsE